MSTVKGLELFLLIVAAAIALSGPLTAVVLQRRDEKKATVPIETTDAPATIPAHDHNGLYVRGPECNLRHELEKERTDNLKESIEAVYDLMTSIDNRLRDKGI